MTEKKPIRTKKALCAIHLCSHILNYVLKARTGFRIPENVTFYNFIYIILLWWASTIDSISLHWVIFEQVMSSHFLNNTKFWSCFWFGGSQLFNFYADVWWHSLCRVLVFDYGFDCFISSLALVKGEVKSHSILEVLQQNKINMEESFGLLIVNQNNFCEILIVK